LPRDQIRLVSQRRQIACPEHQFHGCQRLATGYAQHRGRQRDELRRQPLAVGVGYVVGGFVGHGQPDELRDGSTQRIVQREHELFGLFGHFALADVQQVTGLELGRFVAGDPSEKCRVNVPSLESSHKKRFLKKKKKVLNRFAAFPSRTNKFKHVSVRLNIESAYVSIRSSR